MNQQSEGLNSGETDLVKKDQIGGNQPPRSNKNSVDVEGTLQKT